MSFTLTYPRDLVEIHMRERMTAWVNVDRNNMHLKMTLAEFWVHYCLYSFTTPRIVAIVNNLYWDDTWPEEEIVAQLQAMKDAKLLRTFKRDGATVWKIMEIELPAG